MSSSHVTVCTFNVWGLYISKDRAFRIRAIAHALLTTDFDVVALQELWVQKDYELLVRVLKDVYPHSHRFKSGIVGSGLAVFSRHAFSQLDFWPYRLSGNPLYVHHGDWYAGKGVGHVQIKHPQATIDFFVTHMIANYHQKHKDVDIYSVHRSVQMVDFANFVSGGKSRERSLTIAVGDLNIEDDSVIFREVLGRGLFQNDRAFKMRSAWDEYSGSERATFNRRSNSYYNPSKSEECIDHILYDSTRASCAGVNLFFTEMIDKSGISYSDHCGVVARLVLEERGAVPEIRESMFGDYLLHKANANVRMLEERQAILRVAMAMSFGLYVALSLLSQSKVRRARLWTINQLVLCPLLLTMFLLSFLYGNLWLNYEINNITEAAMEWMAWLQ